MSVEHGANRTDVYVVYCPKGETHRSVIQITIQPGKNLTEEDKRLLDDVVLAAAKLRDATH